MLCTTAIINTSNTIRTQIGAAECHSSGLDSNSCYCVFTIAFNYRSLYDTKGDAILTYELLTNIQP